MRMVILGGTGVFDVLLGLVRRGLGGTAGHGRQYVSWVHGDDCMRAVRWLIARDELAGAVNVAAPEPQVVEGFHIAVDRDDPYTSRELYTFYTGLDPASNAESDNAAYAGAPIHRANPLDTVDRPNVAGEELLLTPSLNTSLPPEFGVHVHRSTVSCSTCPGICSSGRSKMRRARSGKRRTTSSPYRERETRTASSGHLAPPGWLRARPRQGNHILDSESGRALSVFRFALCRARLRVRHARRVFRGRHVLARHVDDAPR